MTERMGAEEAGKAAVAISRVVPECRVGCAKDGRQQRQLDASASRTWAKPWPKGRIGRVSHLLFFFFSIVFFGEGDELLLVLLVTGALPGRHGV